MSAHTQGATPGPSLIAVTFFSNHAAASKRQEALLPGDLVERITRTTAPSKTTLPWIKLAKFGEKLTKRGSLRHDANVTVITGIEADYDGEVMTFDAAHKILVDAGLQAVIYTSPSHRDDAPRWRVLCPLSTELPPTERNRQLARLNGLFGNIFSTESWALSQAYYYGSVCNNPAHRVDLIEGTPIDLLPGLDATAIEKSCERKERPTAPPPDYEPISDRRLEAFRLKILDSLKTAAIDGHKHSALLRYAKSLGGIQTAAGFTDDQACGWLLSALPDSVLDWNHAKQTALDGLARGRDEPIRLADRPRPQKPHKNSKAGSEPPGETSGEAWDDEENVDLPGTGETSSLPIIEEFNRRYMVVNEAGKAVVYAPGYDPILRRRRYDRISFEDLRRLYLNRMVKVGEREGGNPIFKCAADVWLRSPDRRQFIGGVVFDPSGHEQDPGVLNLWRGFAVKPKAGSWSLLKNHLWTVICNQDDIQYRYVMSWMARLVQRPAEQGHTAIVMKGGEGTGKGIVARALLHLMGQHGLAISNAKHLVGNFNGHLRDAVLLFADEAFFAGDRAHVGVLKSIITEPYLTVEAKHQNAVQMPNFLHVIMASNEEWVVPASLDARRFLVLDVSEARKGDHAYFQAIADELDAGGHAAMLQDLLALDLSGFNVRNVPVTEGLQEQRKLSLPTPEAWWLDCLQREYVFRSRFGLEDHFAEWHEEVSTEILFASYVEFAERAHERHPMSRETFGRFMIRLGSRAKRLQKAAVGEHLTDVQNPYGGTNRKSKVREHPRPPGYVLGRLEDARTAFCKATGLAVTWEPPETPDI